jgi:hypothetical protein
MNRRSATIFFLARLGLVFSALVVDLPALAACNAPQYRTGLILENTSTDITLQISMRLEYFAPQQLICLAGEFQEKFPTRNIMVTMFTDQKAAENYLPSLQEQTAWMLHVYSTLHALYVRNNSEDYLLIVPDGKDLAKDSPSNTRIDLPLTGAPVCKLAMRNRCLLEFRQMYYPSFASKTDVSGRVTVKGSIQKNGIISNLTVVDSNVEPSASRQSLSDWTIQNLRTWHFEPGQGVDDFRITFSFVLTESAPAGVEMRLPDEVRLETRRRD